MDEYDLEDYGFARQVVRDVIDRYNHVRRHSALSFLRPVDYYRGDPGTRGGRAAPEIDNGQGIPETGKFKVATTTTAFDGG